MHRVTGADAGNHAHRAGRLDLVDVNDVRGLQDAQVRGLFGFGHQAAQMRLGAVAQIELLDGPVSQVKELQPQAEFAVGGALHHAMPL